MALLVIVVAGADVSRGAAAAIVGVGTGFEVTDGGHLLTNRHVVADCKTVQIRLGSNVDDVIVVATDAEHDLALLSDPKRFADRISHRRLTGSALPYARFRDRNFLVAGESVTVVGFPLQGIVGGINVTTGVVSATSGPGGTGEMFQITAPTQPGSSGGPVLDARGIVVGVVVSQLNAALLAKEHGITPQNVNFAIHGKFAREFVRMSAGQVATDDGSSTSGLIDTATVAGRASQFTFPVQCLK